MWLDSDKGCHRWVGNEVGKGKGAFEAWDDKTAWLINEIERTHASMLHKDSSPTSTNHRAATIHAMDKHDGHLCVAHGG